MPVSGSNLPPDLLQPFFWDCDFTRLDWNEHRDFIIRRVLQSGSWEAITWLRRQSGDDVLRGWIEERRGGGLTARQLRFWELVLDLPHAEVNHWVGAARNTLWEQRTHR